ncbi:MAG TPA: hypothetical protein VH331_16155 [Allosphingosinicella sp.]|jgi:hypothetical protein|nr:hypothetical protein [Allosphingosinicella sp.]
MHIHLPKPLHGWRELVGEVGVIVIGVLIALGAEQIIEQIHWHDQVRAARESIHREMTFDLAEFADRIRVAPCVNRHIAEAERRLAAVSATGSTPPGATNLEYPGRLILSGDYEAEQAAQNLVHFPGSELATLGAWYDQARHLELWDHDEQAAWSGLSLLAGGGSKLGPLDASLLRRDLQTAKQLEWLTVLNAKRQIARGRELGVSPGPSRPDYVQSMCGEANSLNS